VGCGLGGRFFRKKMWAFSFSCVAFINAIWKRFALHVRISAYWAMLCWDSLRFSEILPVCMRSTTPGKK
jgi:hypothetical protein